MMAFGTSCEQARYDSNMSKMCFNRSSNSPRDKGQLTNHKSSSKGTQFEVPSSLHVDDDALTFSSRGDIETGVNVAYDVFNSLGLEMLVGYEGVKSKTECVFFPPPGFFHDKVIQGDAKSESEDICIIPKRESNESKIKRENDVCDDLPGTEPIKVSNGLITFSQFFKCLGSILSCDLQDEREIGFRIASASRAMGKLHSFWKCSEVELHSKCLIFLAMPVNLLLRGCESWSLKESLAKSLNVFLHRSIRRMLGITALEVREDHAKNATIRKKFFDMPDVRRMIAARQLLFVGKIARNSIEQIP